MRFFYFIIFKIFIGREKGKFLVFYLEKKFLILNMLGKKDLCVFYVIIYIYSDYLVFW